MDTRTGFFGVYPMLYAFFDKDERLSRKAMRRQVDACVRAGAHGIACLGIASEMNKLSSSERRRFLDWVAEDVDGRVPLAATVPEPSVPDQIAFARAAEGAGADWLILQPPPIKAIPEQELLRFFGRVADASSGPVAIQNNPVNMDVWLSDPGLRTLVRNHPNVRLLKGEGPVLAVHRMIETLEGQVDVFGGLAGKEAPSLYRAGCVGMIPAPDVLDRHVRLFELMGNRGSTGEEEAERIYREILPLITFINASVENYLCYGKRLVARRIGLDGVYARSPGVQPHPLGEAIVERYAFGLGSLG